MIRQYYRSFKRRKYFHIFYLHL